MTSIVLTEEQARIVSQAQTAIPVYDANGRVLGHFEPLELTPEQIAEFKRRAASPGPCHTGEQVQSYLQALEEEWQRTGGFDESYMRAFLARISSGERR
jgi:hypothetical protein